MKETDEFLLSLHTLQSFGLTRTHPGRPCFILHLISQDLILPQVPKSRACHWHRKGQRQTMMLTICLDGQLQGRRDKENHRANLLVVTIVGALCSLGCFSEDTGPGRPSKGPWFLGWFISASFPPSDQMEDVAFHQLQRRTGGQRI